MFCELDCKATEGEFGTFWGGITKFWLPKLPKFPVCIALERALAILMRFSKNSDSAVLLGP